MPINTRHACDRCYSLKERCEWLRSHACSRCDRLHLECLMRRPLRKPGRPRRLVSQNRALLNVASTTKNSEKLAYGLTSSSIPRCISEFADLQPSDQHLIQNILFDDTLLDFFLIGPSFWERHRSFLITHFSLSSRTLKHAYLALALVFQGHSHTITSSPDNVELIDKHASSALAHLRRYQLGDNQSISECLALGALIVSFTLCSTHTASSAICNQTLSLVKEAYESAQGFGKEDLVFMSCLVLPEILHCLLRGSIPTLRYRILPGQDDHVDRYIGICTPLLPYLYDICELSSAARNFHRLDMAQISQSLERVEFAVTAWQPHIPEDFTTKFTATEVSHMLCQAYVMRIGALLLVHRLRYPFGTNDGPALDLATRILTHLHMIQTATKKRILSIALPLVVACAEIENEDDREVWQSRIPDLVGYSSNYATVIGNLVASIWEARKERGGQAGVTSAIGLLCQ